MQATVDISRAISIGGWMSEAELLWLAQHARECDKIVEFGSYVGRSTRALGDNIKEGGRIWAVDPWNGMYPSENGSASSMINTYVYPYFKSNMLDLMTTGTVIPVRGFSYSFKLPFKVDMVFIDGDHRYDSCVRDIEKARELVRDGGIIAGHDYGHFLWSDVAKVVDSEFDPAKVNHEETIWWTQKC